MTILGIDPGKSGAVAVLMPDRTRRFETGGA
jgi:hypothetical protein